MKNNLLIIVTTWATLTIATVPTFAAGDAAAGEKKSTQCAICHTKDGNSINPIWPKLAGQSAKYITKQLQDFKAGRRSDDSMRGQVESLSEQDIEDLAAYFSSQTNQPSKSDKPELLKVGENTYKKGRIKEHVTACVGCHGFTGAGNSALFGSIKVNSPVEAPLIGSQHAVYVVKQLKAFRDETRSNDIGKIMRNIAAEMTDEEIEAVAQYIATLH